ncbi:DUF721 domain-containing protein [Phenylobacterium sp.]|uniref:DUF721 domain-containing protein n=1 Tax=Phenylobacterium sp. TaxID=1871053 RepID=UPI00272FF146|nr:DciA family protein [Phenylobacterium sp.]MDP1874941.1 DciA family protein [Phenylobacterium sp.]MDP3491190.1 DciA family protein [Phenylobacterium sp.]
MAPRSLPDLEETRQILASRRTRPAPRPPPPAGRGLSKLIRELDARFGQGPGALQARWREIVGEQIARRTEPVKLVKGRNGAGAALEIRVAGPSAALVQHQAPEILSRVNLFLGSGAVERLRIVQGPLRPAPASTAQAPRKRQAPLDAAQEAELSQSLAGAAEGPLKSALLALGRGVMRNAQRR